MLEIADKMATLIDEYKLYNSMKSSIPRNKIKEVEELILSHYTLILNNYMSTILLIG